MRRFGTSKPVGEIMGLFKPKSYAGKLQSVEWRNFTTSIRSAARNACQHCRRNDLETQVHHFFYDPKLQPWEHDRQDVALLCAPCHQLMHEELKKFRRYVFGYFNAQSMRVINGALAVAVQQYQPLVFAHALAAFVSQPGLVQGQAGDWDASETDKPKPLTQ